jgi:hypothetical protein
MDYVHLEVGEDIVSISGTFTPLKELRLKHNGRDVLCVIGQAVVDTACCGSGSFVYATVPGYIDAWKEGTSEGGAPMSRVEPIHDEATRREVAKTIKESENIWNINFW